VHGVDPTLRYVTAVQPVPLPRRLAASAAAAVALLTASIVGIPVCPTQTLLHLDCPACGGTRAVRSLVTGDVAGAIDHNVLLVLALPVLAFVGVRWLPGRSVVPRRSALPALVVLLATFTVLRNLAVPGLAWLDAA
jgi:hypothetical protein